ncbi:MAG: biotin/lipoate A/B protein ligase family protein [Armatimonadota bacterium]|nr:biotin/lipoate A/B protein ligase family protein [Armatimonadota bacterium]
MSNTWRLLVDDGVGAAEGLALDEALMGHYARGCPARPPTLRLYTYRSHCALVGRYQHLEAEVDLEACRQTGTHVNRRPTGGGAILMGEDQLGVALVMRAPPEHPQELLRRLSQGIVAGLRRLGIHAAFGGKNDLQVGTRKIAGLGIYLDGHGALLFHASVLADLDIPFMLRVLRIPAAKLGDKGVEAVAHRVTTVTEQTSTHWTGAALRVVVAQGYAEAFGVSLSPAEPEPSERERAARLEREKYRTAQWVDQLRPQPDLTGSALVKTPAGLLRVYLSLVGSTIKSAMIVGDFNEFPEELARFEAALKWSRLERGELRRIASRILSGRPLGTSAEQLVEAVLQAGERARARQASLPLRQEGSCYFPEVKEHAADRTGGV